MRGLQLMQARLPGGELHYNGGASRCAGVCQLEGLAEIGFAVE